MNDSEDPRYQINGKLITDEAPEFTDLSDLPVIIRRQQSDGSFPWSVLGGLACGAVTILLTWMTVTSYSARYYDADMFETAMMAFSFGIVSYSLLFKVKPARNSPAALYDRNDLTLNTPSNPGAQFPSRVIPLNKIFQFQIASEGLAELYFRGPVYDYETGSVVDPDSDQSITLEGNPADVAAFLERLRELGVRGR